MPTLSKNTTILIIAFTVIITVVILGVKYGWFGGVNALDLDAMDGEVDRKANGKIDKTRYTRLAQYAHDQLEGWNWNATDTSAWVDVVNQLDSMNKNELRIVSNEYDRLYNSKLRALLQNEWTGCSMSITQELPNTPCYKLYYVQKTLLEIGA